VQVGLYGSPKSQQRSAVSRTDQEESRVMTVQETAAELRVSVSTVRRLIRSGDLAKTKVRRRTVVTAASIAAYVAANTSKEAAA
jgi:excisionase family DNA binding protein